MSYLALFDLFEYLMGQQLLEIFLLFRCGDRLWTPESEVDRHSVKGNMGIDFGRQSLKSIANL